MKHVMIDLETLGTVASSVIMSVGAVKFDLATGKIAEEGFYASISIESNLDYQRRVQEDTMLWWLKQDAAAQNVFHEQKVPLASALEDLSDWLGDKQSIVWSNGADFDIPMLAHAYSQVGIETPWEFWNARCFRTYKNLPGAKDIRVPPAGVKHNALSDAYQQAQTLCLIHKTLFAPQKARA